MMLEKVRELGGSRSCFVCDGGAACWGGWREVKLVDWEGYL